MDSLIINVYKVEIVIDQNEYSRNNLTDMFKEEIRINPLTCIYGQWGTTKYHFTSEQITDNTEGKIEDNTLEDEAIINEDKVEDNTEEAP